MTRDSRTAEHIDMLMADVERLQEIDRQRVETNNSLTIENARLQERAERAEAELSNALCEVVSDDSEWCLTWDGKTAGQWAGQCKQVEAERDALLADAERWRFFRDADRSAGLDMELVALYSMESLDDFIDAAMRDKEQSNG